jgi:hypothetical protein
MAKELTQRYTPGTILEYDAAHLWTRFATLASVQIQSMNSS